MIKITSDPAREITWYFRINRDNQKVFRFYDSSGDDFSLTDYTFVLNFKKRGNDSSNILQLTSGSGLTKTGNELTVQIAKTQAALFQDRTYFVELVRTKDSLERTWFTIDGVFHNGKFDGVGSSSEDVTIYDSGGDVVSVTINDGGLSVDALSQESYSTTFTFNNDKEIFADLTGLSPTITLSSTNAVNGIGIIFRANKPTAITFAGVASEASTSSATLDATKMNVYSLIYFSNWNNSGTPRVIYSNSLFTAV